MASYKSLLKSALLNYPNIFRYPLEFSEYLFSTIGNGYFWTNKGDVELLRYKGMKKDENKMKYEKSHDCLSLRFQKQCDLQTESVNLLRKWTESNIDEIVNVCDPVTILFGVRHRANHYVENPSTYAFALNFPNNITVGWRKVLLPYLNYWLSVINGKYMGLDIPKDMLPMYNLIKEKRTKIEIQCGIDREGEIKISDEIINEVINEERQK